MKKTDNTWRDRSRDGEFKGTSTNFKLIANDFIRDAVYYSITVYSENKATRAMHDHQV